MNKEIDPVQTSGTRRWSAWTRTFRRSVRLARWPAVVVVCAFLGVLLYGLLFPAPVPLGRDEIDESVQHAMASATPSELRSV